MLRRATDAEAAGPIGWRGGVGVHFRLFVERTAQQVVQAVDFAEIGFVARFAYGDFGQVVAQDVFGVDAFHGCGAHGVDAALRGQMGAVIRSPGVKAGAVDEQVAQWRVQRVWGGIKIAQRAEENGVVELIFVQDFQ